MIVFQDVRKSFDGAPILRQISFNVDKGERVSLIGPGGCGKTTILKILLGLVTPDAGQTFMMGKDVNTLTAQAREDLMCRVGIAFQQGGLFDFMTVSENLEFAMRNMTDMSSEAIAAKTKELLAGVKLPKTINMFPHELSGGMKRRIGIARALCTDPEVALFDEPTSGLDPVTSTIILNMIMALAGGSAHEKTLLVSTTNVEIAIRFADRVIVVHDGEVVADGLWRKLLVEGSPWVKKFLGMRLIGLSLDYAHELGLPEAFINAHWSGHS